MKDTTAVDNSTSESTDGGWMHNRTTLILSIGFLVLVLVAAAGVAGSRWLDGGKDAAAPTGGPSEPAAVTSTGAPVPSGFGVPSADQLGRAVARPNNPAGQPLAQSPVPHGDYSCPSAPNCPVVDAPAGMMWQQVTPYVLPFSTSDGPAKVDGVLASGYTRTPQGAALAAWQIPWRAGISRAIYDVVLSTQTVGSAQDFAALAPKKDWDYSHNPTLFLHPSAFRLTSWDGTHAVVQYALPDKTPNAWYVAQFDVMWSGGDWKLRAPERSANSHKIALASLVGWTSW